MSNTAVETKEMKLFQERLTRVETAIKLGTPDRVPIAPLFSSYIQRSNGSSFRDLYYDYEKAGDAAIKFYSEHPMCDLHGFSGFTSGRANELAQTSMIDWPGSPSGKIDIYSSHQVIEHEFMTQEEYPEMLNDFTGFMLRKYIPRAYPALKDLSAISLIPTIVLNTRLLSSLYNPGVQKAFSLISQIGAEDQKAGELSAKYLGQLAAMGFPGLVSGASEAPYDILGDYFRGTMGMFEDLVDDDMQEYIERACNLFADQQIASLQYLRYLDIPVKRVFFPLHKGMDGFMNAEQYERLYWKPLKKIVLALVDMGVTPYLYTEGPYDSRLEQLTDVPKGKVLYHFEKVNMKEAKRILGGTACICGNLSISALEFSKKETIIEETKRLLDVCMPGGGYIFDFNGSLDNAKPENLDAMFETLDIYGHY